ncbi:MAG: GCN5-related N-acetyltransferase [Aeromicrobium sp.]|nr:GCN5-related N-acetyltransferase [Aeromicrobium sp.]
MPHIRLVTPDDVPVLTELLNTNRDFLAPFDPVREGSYFTVEGQAEVIALALENHEAGRLAPYVVLNDDGAVIGRITLNDIVRGALQSAAIGYWVDVAHNGRGLASAAVSEMIAVAFDELKLHRLEAGTLLDNVRSQRVLERNGFERYGVAAKLLKIQGRWQDHVMFQLLSPHEV